MKKEIKRTFTYSGRPSVRKKAARKAKSLGRTLSEVIDEHLDNWTSPPLTGTGSIPAINLHQNIIGQDPHNPL